MAESRSIVVLYKQGKHKVAVTDLLEDLICTFSCGIRMFAEVNIS